MKQSQLHRLVWLPLAFLVLVTPALLNTTLDVFGQTTGAESGTSIYSAARDLAELPLALPIRLDKTPMPVRHTQPSQGVYYSEYTSTLKQNGEGLVPYIPRVFDIDQYTQLNQTSVDINGEPFHQLKLRRKFSQRHYIGFYQFRVGAIHTDSYTKAKLFQLPAAFTGANQFMLAVWQTECEQADCQTERDRLQAQLAAR